MKTGRTNRVSLNCRFLVKPCLFTCSISKSSLIENCSVLAGNFIILTRAERRTCPNMQLHRVYLISVTRQTAAPVRLVFRPLLGVTIKRFSCLLANYGTFPQLGTNSSLKLIHFWHVAVFPTSNVTFQRIFSNAECNATS